MLCHPLRDRKDDTYETPACAVHALLCVENLPARIWEPCCGSGNIVRVLRESGREVCAGDLVDRGCPLSVSGVDFLMEWRAPHKLDCIVTNPPYKLTEEFVLKAVELCPLVIMLLRLQFVAGQRKRLTHVLDEPGMLSRIYVFRERLPMMHRDGWAGPKSTSQQDYGWFVFDRSHRGPPGIRRISWKWP